MRRPAGFTLLEVVVSLVLASVVSLLVYGAARAAEQTRTRLEESRRETQRALLMRLLIEETLHGAQTLPLTGDTAFLLVDRSGFGGRPLDRLTWVASDGLPPLGEGADWAVTLEPTPAGLRLEGAPVGVAAPSRLLGLLPGVFGLDVQVRGLGADSAWTRQWASPALLPAGVRLSFWSDSGVIGVPLDVGIPLGGRR